MGVTGWLQRVFGAGDERSPARGDPERVAAVQRVLDELEPMIAADGGHIHLVAVEAGRVEVRLEGACKRCFVSEDTLFEALEPKLRATCSWFQELRSV